MAGPANGAAMAARVNNKDVGHGGGGGALGGAIFSYLGNLTVRNSTFFNNFVTRGEGGGGSADNGADAGGAIYAYFSQIEIENCTFSGNQSTGSAAAIGSSRTAWPRSPASQFHSQEHHHRQQWS